MSKIDLNDPRLTAYALNEMEPAERAEFEQMLAQDAAARQVVEEIGATASLLTGALEHEAQQPVEKPAPRHDTYAKVIHFPYWKISGLAAACFALFFIYLQRHEVVTEQKQYIEVPLTAAPEKAAEAPASVAVAQLETDTVARDMTKRDENQSQVMARLAKQAQESSAREQVMAARKAVIDSANKKTSGPAAPMHKPATVEARIAAPASMAAGQSELKDEAVVLSPSQVAVQDKIGSDTSLTLADVSAWTRQTAMMNSRMVGLTLTDLLAEENFGGARQDDGYLRARLHPLSHIGAKVATASYAEVQRFLSEGRRPPVEAVRIEELLNHFTYNYTQSPGNAPFSANLEVAGAPWAPTHRLVRIGLRARAPGDVTGNGARVEPPAGQLVIIARDVQIQVEFNPREVQAYRLVGYENRPPAKEEPSRARADIGVDGKDQALTVLYEVVPVGAEMPGTDDTLKYEKLESPRAGSLISTQTDMLTVEIRYREPVSGVNRRLEFPLRDHGAAFARASDDFKFAAAVASFGMMLRDSPFKGTATWGAVAVWARDGMGDDAGGQRSEFLGLVERARQLPQ
jgi:anti-sigma factor RsiW